MAKQLHIYGPIVQDKFYDNDVSDSDVKEFIAGLDEDEELDVHINSGGGAVHAGLAIYNTIKAHKGYTTVYIDGFACSIASVIAFCGDKLVIPESALMMIHLPYVGTVGNKLELQETIKTLDKIEQSLLAVYNKNLRKQSDRQKIKDFLYAETWFTGEELADYFNVILQKDSDSKEVAASANVLTRFKRNNKNESSSADQAEEYKRMVLQKMAVAKQRNSKNERDKVKETKKNILTRFKKDVNNRQSSSVKKKSVLDRFSKGV